MENYNVTDSQVDMADVIYTGKTHTTGGRDGGSSRSSDGNLDIKLSVPGAAGSGTNPEQLFAAGWSACFIGAMKGAAGKMKVRFPLDGTVDAEPGKSSIIIILNFHCKLLAVGRSSEL